MRFIIMTSVRHADVYVYFALRVNTSCNCHFLTRIVQKNHTSFKVLRSDTKLFSIVFRIKHINSVADPGFPRGVGANPTGGANIRFCQNFQKKLHEIERIRTPASLAPPLDPPLKLFWKLIKKFDQEELCETLFIFVVSRGRRQLVCALCWSLSSVVHTEFKFTIIFCFELNLYIKRIFPEINEIKNVLSSLDHHWRFY